MRELSPMLVARAAPKGASAKGLSRPENENRRDIERVLSDNPQAELAIFVFGAAARLEGARPQLGSRVRA